jgi:predicted GNAT family acetyltransferase
MVLHVERIADEERFIVRHEGHTALLRYDRSPGRAALVETLVPPALEGRGIGSLLVRSAVEWAESEGLLIEPVCPFVRAWFRRHPEALDLLAPEARLDGEDDE